MLGVRIQILVAAFVLVCGPVFVWRRRDNIFGYFQVGFFFISFFAPLLIEATIGIYDPSIVKLYARILTVGAIASLIGLAFGAQFGNRSVNKVPISFARPLPEADVPWVVVHRVRLLTAAAVVSLVTAYWVLGYVPFFASDRLSAKYGVGQYLAGFLRGGTMYHFALALGSAILPVAIYLAWRRPRRGIDIAMCATLAFGLMLTLSRDAAFAGPAVFFVAWCIHRRMRPGTTLAIVCLTFSLGALTNELVFSPRAGGAGSTLERIAANAPDIHDHIGFLQGFRLLGSERIGTKTVVAGLSPGGKSEWEPSAYTLRTLTGAQDVTGFLSGGLRLPSPIWGYAAYGYVGVVIWSFLTGLFTGWGTTKVRRLLDLAGEHPPGLLNLILAVVFYNGTFGLLAEFYFAQTSGFVFLGVALTLGLYVVIRLHPGAGREIPVSTSSAGRRHSAEARPLPSGRG